MQRVNGKTCIVTGAALGIGRACALRLAGEGASVALFDMLDEEGHALLAELQAACHESTRWRSDSAGSTCWSTTPASPAPTSPPMS